MGGLVVAMEAPGAVPAGLVTAATEVLKGAAVPRVGPTAGEGREGVVLVAGRVVGTVAAAMAAEGATEGATEVEARVGEATVEGAWAVAATDLGVWAVAAMVVAAGAKAMAVVREAEPREGRWEAEMVGALVAVAMVEVVAPMARAVGLGASLAVAMVVPLVVESAVEQVAVEKERQGQWFQC